MGAGEIYVSLLMRWHLVDALPQLPHMFVPGIPLDSTEKEQPNRAGDVCMYIHAMITEGPGVGWSPPKITPHTSHWLRMEMEYQSAVAIEKEGSRELRGCNWLRKTESGETNKRRLV